MAPNAISLFFIGFSQILPLDEFFYEVKSYQIFYHSEKILKICTDFAKYIEKTHLEAEKLIKNKL